MMSVYRTEMSELKGGKCSTGNVRNHNDLYAYLSSCSLKNNPAEKMMENYIAHPSVSVSV